MRSALARRARGARRDRATAARRSSPTSCAARKRLPGEVEEALWQLVAAGLVTADGFDALRSLDRSQAPVGREGLARAPALVGRPLDAACRRRPSAIDAEAFARRLLARWGVVFRDVVARETLAPPWRELLLALRRMEARGEIRGGRFVAGYVGEQYALPDAIDALRAVRRTRRNRRDVTARRLRSVKSRRDHHSGAGARRRAGISTPCRSARLNRSR